MIYHVQIHEVWIQKIAVEADSPEEARQKVLEGEGEYLDGELEYSRAMDNEEEWVVEKAAPE